MPYNKSTCPSPATLMHSPESRATCWWARWPMPARTRRPSSARLPRSKSAHRCEQYVALAAAAWLSCVFARPENAVARNDPSAGAAYSRPTPAPDPCPSSSAIAGNSAMGNPKVMAIEVGGEDRLDRVLALHEPEPVDDRGPADRRVLVRRRRRLHPPHERDHDEERDDVDEERARRLDREDQDAGEPPARPSPATVPNPASSAFDDGSSPGGQQARRPRGHGGPVERVEAGGERREHVERPQQRLVAASRSHAISADITARIACITMTNRRRSTASANAPPTIGNTNTGHERAEPQQTDRERRMRQLVDLERHDGRHDLVAEVRDRLADEEQAEVARLAERREVHEMLAESRDDAAFGDRARESKRAVGPHRPSPRQRYRMGGRI